MQGYLIQMLFFLFVANSLVAQSGDINYDLEERLIFVRSNLENENPNKVDVYDVLDILDDAYDFCYTGIVLESNIINYIAGINDDVDSDINSNMHKDRWINLKTVLAYAKELGLTVYPAAAQFGGSHTILKHDPHLAEGIPVIDAKFIIKEVDGKIQLVNDPSDRFSLINGNFETDDSQNPGGFYGWRASVFEGESSLNKAVFSDVKDGSRCLMIVDPQNFGRGVVNITQRIEDLDMFREYEISVRMKTENFSRPAHVDVGVSAIRRVTDCSKNSKLQLNSSTTYNESEKKYDFLNSDQDWKVYHTTFNTLENDFVIVDVHAIGGTGKVWIDDIIITPTKFNNVLKRNDTPITLKSSNGTELQNEERLKDLIVDPLFGRSNWVWHKKPEIVIPPNASGLVPGDKVLVSYYTTTGVYNTTPHVSLTHPAAINLADLQMRQIHNKFNEGSLDMFDGFFFSHDEIRVHGWDNTSKVNTPGENLAINFEAMYNSAKTIDPNGKILVWSDMFDPFHNAITCEDRTYPYYAVNGDWDDSVGTLPEDVVIMNWHGFANRDRISTGKHFSDQGHSQILAGFYDHNFYTRDWLTDLSSNSVKNVRGVMYTSFKDDFTKLEEWANYVWGGCDGQFNSSN